MKVYIGPYKNWKTTYKFWDKFENKLSEKTIDRLDDISQTVVNYCWNKPLRKDSGQKVKVKIHGYDAYSLDYTLAYIIHPALVELKKQKPGSPHVDDSDVPEDIRSDKAPPKKINMM